MAECIKCRSFQLCPWATPPEIICSSFKPRTQTNADRIRSMTDEELDKFLGEVQWDVANYCGGVTQKQEYPVPEQRGAWLDWLREEAVSDG